MLALGLALVTAIAEPHHHAPDFAGFAFSVSILVKRLSTRTPALPVLQVRRWLTILAIALFFALYIDYQWCSLSFPAYLDAMAGAALLLVCYDHWLLGHLLPVRRTEPPLD